MILRDELYQAWRARHVLLIGQADRMTGFMHALLGELGAKCRSLSPASDTEALDRAMTHARISAVIVPRLDALAPGRSIPAQLDALLRLLGEAREAGVPLVILLSDAAVYRTHLSPWRIQEDDPTGGETRGGLIASLLQMAADGASRGLLGDAVSTIIARHPPCLGCGHPAVQPYTAWCRALDEGQLIDVPCPARSGVFVHPLDVCCGALLLGARYLLGDRQITGAFNLGAGAENTAANRTAALRFIRENGGTRPIRETEPPAAAALPLPDGAKARLLCGAQCMIPGPEALGLLLALERAARRGAKEEQRHMEEAARAYIQRL